MSVPFAAVVTPDSLVFTAPDGKTHTITSENGAFEDAKAAIKASQQARKEGHIDLADKWVDVLIGLATPAVRIDAAGQGRVVVRDGVVTFDGETIHSALTDRILWGLNEGYDMQPYIAFLENVMENPSKRAVDELFGFIEASRMGITDDGHILAYKRVRPDFKDLYTGTMDNSPGKIVRMARNKVNEDPYQTCSQGLHVCSQSYLPHYGGGSNNAILIVKINPADVVSVPVDYNNAKMRVCRYEVLGPYEGTDKEDLLATKPIFESSEWGSYRNYTQDTTDNGEFSVGDLVVCTSLDGLTGLEDFGLGQILRVYAIEDDELIFEEDGDLYPAENFLLAPDQDDDGEPAEAADEEGDIMAGMRFTPPKTPPAMWMQPPAEEPDAASEADWDRGIEAGYVAGKAQYLRDPAAMAQTAMTINAPRPIDDGPAVSKAFDGGYQDGFYGAYIDGTQGRFADEDVTMPMPTPEPVFEPEISADAVETATPEPSEPVLTYRVGQRVTYNDGSFRQYVITRVSEHALEALPIRGGGALVSEAANFTPAVVQQFEVGDMVIDRRTVGTIWKAPVYVVDAVAPMMISITAMDGSSTAIKVYPELFDYAPPAMGANDPDDLPEPDPEPLPVAHTEPLTPPAAPMGSSAGPDTSGLLAAIRRASGDAGGAFSFFPSKPGV